MSVSLEPASAPARSRADTRRRLVASGTELFARRGLHAATTHAIANGAGVAAGTFYLHFKDKAALFREIALDAIADLGARLARAGGEASDLESAVRGRAIEVTRFAAENRDLVQILFGRGHELPELGSEILDSFAASLESRLDQQIARGAYHRALHAGATAQAIVGMIARVVVWWTEDPARATQDEVVATLARLQLSGVQPGSEDFNA